MPDNEEVPTVSVVIPVHDDPDGLRRVLEAMVEQDYPADRIEVVVADDGSSQPVTWVTSDYPSVRLLELPHRGSYAARNAAIEAAAGTIIAFTDADAQPALDWISRAVAALADVGPLAAVTGPIEVTTRARPSGAELVELLHAFPQEFYVRERHFGATANLVTTADALRRVGPFDGSLRSGGDNEWGQRAQRAGVRVSYRPEIVVRHSARTTLRALWRKQRRVLRGRTELRRRNVRTDRDDLVYLATSPLRTIWHSRNDPRIAGLRRARYSLAVFVFRVMQLVITLWEANRLRRALASDQQAQGR